MDWFERLTGFRENGYEETRRQLEVVGDRLHSRVNGKSYGVGKFELVSLESLRNLVRSRSLPGQLKVSVIKGDVRHLHQLPEYEGALFQVASQFNMLEMTGPEITPEDGVTHYQSDPTQGPACAIAAGAATVYRNYFVPVGEQIGQTSKCQLDGLASLGSTLAKATGKSVTALWKMRNGYALCTRTGLDAVSGHLASLAAEEVDVLRGKLCIGLHTDVEVTDANGSERPKVSQAFCSALPVAYSSLRPDHWQGFATLVLEAAYEATLWAAVLNAQRGVSNVVLFTRLGGGAFGNQDEWIDAAMSRALQLAKGLHLDVKIVSFGTPSREVLRIADEFRRVELPPDKLCFCSWLLRVVLPDSVNLGSVDTLLRFCPAEMFGIQHALPAPAVCAKRPANAGAVIQASNLPGL